MHWLTRGRSFIIPSPPISAFRTFSSIIHIEHIYIVVVWYSIIIRIAVILTIIDPGTSTMTGWTAGGEGVLIGCLPSSFDHWTTNALRDGAPFLLLIETPPTFGRSERFFDILHENQMFTLSHFSLAVCGHHLSPRGGDSWHMYHILLRT